MDKKNHPAPSGQRRVDAAIHSEPFSGPLPHPDILVKYNAAVPDAAERILRMAESQAAHRRDMEARVVRSNTFNQTLGSVLGFLLCAGTIAGGFYLISSGASIVGITAIIAALAGLASVFVVGRRSQELERLAKRKDFKQN